ncbi:MAG TPA: glycosyltransferase [Geminicoccaceae bacterium]|nr:glycosyltransferase [Geminicoccaceae bacterium]
MKFVLFYHSLVSDWNHGNAHFLRGIVRELTAREHEVQLYEPADGWSRRHLLADHGERALAEFQTAFPGLSSTTYDLPSLDLDGALACADVVIVHEWNAPELVARIGRHRAAGGGYRLLFHDTHHRSASAPNLMQTFELDAFDGILAFGEAVRELYFRHGWARRAWTWHEAADVRLCRPIEGERREGDLVWVGNWGDGERTAELDDFLLEPVRRLGLAARVYGVRYPEHALHALAAAGASYGGWLPNHRVPEVFARFAVTVHVPRRPYVRALPGIPTIRVFEALACGIPLVSAPWDDVEGLFGPDDMLFAADSEQMTRYVCAVLADRDLAQTLAHNGLATVCARHTCGHRVDQLLGICTELGAASAPLPEVA